MTMRYVIYDTNEYYGMVGNSNRSFKDLEHTIDELRENEQKKGFVPIFNSTVAYELINHLCTENIEEQELYLRACYALYYHCKDSLPVVTKNPTATYIENIFHVEPFPFERTIEFLEKIYNAPNLETLGRCINIIQEISSFMNYHQMSYLRDLQSVRNLFKENKVEQKKTKDMIASDSYLTWKTVIFLEGIVQICMAHNIDLSTSLVGQNAISTFINEHRTYLEICHRFDKTFIEGGYDLTNAKNANTFWDAEICYHVGTKINNTEILVVTEEGQLHKAAELAGQANMMLYKKQIYE